MSRSQRYSSEDNFNFGNGRYGATHQKKEAAPVQEPPSAMMEYRRKALELVSNRWFDVGIGVVIALNAASIGIEQSFELERKDTSMLKVLESFFLVIYIFEVGLRLFAHGRQALSENWVRLDIFLVVVGVGTSWIVEPFSAADSLTNFGPVLGLRLLRLLRLAKTVRLFARFQECWMLVRGFLNSASIVPYSMGMLFITLYTFSCLGVELISKHRLNDKDEFFEAHVQTHFSSLPQTMFTLVRFACLDNTAEVYKPLVDKDPWLAVYFLVVILVISMVFFHLLGAVYFSSTLEQNNTEHDNDKQMKEIELMELLDELKVMFRRLDKDRSGNLSKEELMTISDDDRDRLCRALGCTSPLQIFNALDVDRSGTVTINEFFDGVWDVAFSRGDVQMRRMEKQVENIHWRLKEVFSAQHEMAMQMEQVLGRRAPRLPLTGRSSGEGSRQPELQIPSQLCDNVDRSIQDLIVQLKCTWEESLVAALEKMSLPPPPPTLETNGMSLGEGRKASAAARSGSPNRWGTIAQESQLSQAAQAAQQAGSRRSSTDSAKLAGGGSKSAGSKSSSSDLNGLNGNRDSSARSSTPTRERPSGSSSPSPSSNTPRPAQAPTAGKTTSASSARNGLPPPPPTKARK